MNVSTVPVHERTAASGLLARYAASLGGELSGSRMSLHIDDRYRVQLHTLPDGRIRVRARLRALPEAGPRRDELLLGVGRLCCGRMNDSAAACVVDAEESALWLQQVEAAASTQDVDELVGAFVNELAFWTQAVPNE